MTLAAVLLALSSSAAGEETTHEPYRVLRTRNAETLQRDLRRVAAEGYRVLGASMGSTVVGQPRIVVLLRHDPEQLYEYAVFAPSGNLEESASTEAMNALGASGYRLSSGNLLAQRVEDFWLPETAYEAQLTLILERSASPRRFTYETVRFSDFEADDGDGAHARSRPPCAAVGDAWI